MPTLEPSNRQILQAIQKSVQTLSKQVASNTTDLRTVKTSLADVKSHLGTVTDDLESVKDTVEFLKENVVTRDELRAEIRSVRDDMISHVDHFVQLHKKQEVELVALSNRMTRHESLPHRKS